MQLQLQTWVEVEAYLESSRGIILPIGSTEQHGPTGLIGTDAICAEVIARGVGEAAGALVAPTVAVGMAQHHLGFPGSDLRFEIARSHIGDTRALDGGALKCLFDEMEAEGFARLRASFDGQVRATRSADMRYGEQVFEVAVPLDGVDWTKADPLPEIVERFHRRHEELYTYSLPDQETVLVNARVAVAGMLASLPQEPALPPAPPTTPCSEWRIYLDHWVGAPVYDFDALAPAQTLWGPAIVDSATTTILLRPGESATVTALGWLDITLTPRGAS